MESSTEHEPKMLSIEELSNSLKRFGNIDYIVFGAMLFSCSCVGLYFGYEDHMKHKRSKKGRRGSLIDVEAIDYLMGGRNMKVFPVAMSLVASFVSGITLLGTSTEIYLYGTQYMFILIAVLIASTIMHFIFIPIFHELQITSAYEYLQLRFDKKVRLFGSIMYSVATILWLPIVIYVPALAFNQTTGVNIHVITPIVMAICILYTMVGGIKAVVWTDVIQIMLMYGTLFLIVIKGTLNVGGLKVVIERNLHSGRFEEPDFHFDPTIRHTFWSLVVGGTIFWLNVNGLNQNMIQRYLALKDVRTARKGQMIYVVGIIVMICLCCYNGLLLFATYHDCDPLTTKLATAKDQMMPLLVMEILKDLPGLPGLFIAGVFSAALSSLSTGLNSMSAVVLEDFFKPYAKHGIPEAKSSLIMRGTVLILGCLSVGLVYIVQHMGSVLQLSMSIPTACFGPMLGVFTVGFMFPSIGTKPTLISAIFSCTSMMWLVFKAQAEIALGHIKFPTKPLFTDGCSYNFTLATTTPHTPVFEDAEMHFYEVSYLYYALIGSGIVVIGSLLLSFVFGFQDPTEVDPRLIAPFLRKYINSKTDTFHYKTPEGKDVTVHKFSSNGSLHN